MFSPSFIYSLILFKILFKLFSHPHAIFLLFSNAGHLSSIETRLILTFHFLLMISILIWNRLRNMGKVRIYIWTFSPTIHLWLLRALRALMSQNITTYVKTGFLQVSYWFLTACKDSKVPSFLSCKFHQSGKFRVVITCYSLFSLKKHRESRNKAH